MQLVTCALTSYGGWGDEFLNKKVVPEYKRRLKDEKEEGGSGWESRRWLEGLYEDMSINIARSNYAMLADRAHYPAGRPPGGVSA